jgi:hypothetical protein
MEARVGDRITMAAEHVGQSTREGVIREVKGAGGAPPYVVEWADGHTGLIHPGPGSVLRCTHPGDEPATS